MSGLGRSVRGDLGVNPPGTQPPRPANSPPPPDGPPGGGPPGDAPPLPAEPPDSSKAIYLALVWLIRLLVAMILYFFLLHLFLATGVCPATSEVAAAAPPESPAVPPESRYGGGTVMFSDALGWLEYYQHEATWAGPAANAVAGRESARIAVHAAGLSRGVLEMEEAFARGAVTQDLELDALGARLSRARDEVRHFEDAKRPWLCHLACLPCGFIPGTLPCPIHPVAIARREVEAVIKVLSSMLDAHLDLLKQHEDVEMEHLQAANDDVCQASKILHTADSNRGPGQRKIPRLRDLGSTAFGVCQLTGREINKGEQFRQQQLWNFMDDLRLAKARVGDISSGLDKADADLSWSPEHIRVGIVAINELLEMSGSR